MLGDATPSHLASFLAAHTLLTAIKHKASPHRNLAFHNQICGTDFWDLMTTDHRAIAGNIGHCEEFLPLLKRHEDAVTSANLTNATNLPNTNLLAQCHLQGI